MLIMVLNDVSHGTFLKIMLIMALDHVDHGT